MQIDRLGELSSDPDIPEWFVSEPIPVPYFDNKPLRFRLCDLEESDRDDVAAAIDAFFRLDVQDRAAAGPYVFVNYQQMADLVDEDDLGCSIDSHDGVWDHVNPEEVVVSRRSRRDKAIYLQLMAECTWEPEHGLQIVYRHGRDLVRVSRSYPRTF